MRRRARKLVHLDLKSANVLLQDKSFSVAKIADLGLSKYLGECSMLDHTMRVCLLDLPPDVGGVWWARFICRATCLAHDAFVLCWIHAMCGLARFCQCQFDLNCN